MPSASAFRTSWKVSSGARSVFFGRVLAQDALQGAAMHVQPPRRLRDVAVALLEHALDMLPAYAVGRHRIAGRRRQLAAVRVQRLLDRVGVGGLGEIVDGAFLNGGHRGRDVAVAGQNDDADVGPRLAQRLHQFQPVAVTETKIEHGEGGRPRGLRQRLGHRAHGRDDEAAQFERARDPVAERRVVVGDQQRPFLAGSRARKRGRNRTAGACVLGHGDSFHIGRYVALKTGFGQRTDTAAPPSAERRLPKMTVAPVRSSSVLAMKTPNPIWPSSPWRVEMNGVPSSSSRASEKPGPSSETSTSDHVDVQRVTIKTSRCANDTAFCTMFPTPCTISGLRTWIGAVVGTPSPTGPASKVMTILSER